MASFKRTLISFFILLNLFAVFQANFPRPLAKKLDHIVESKLAPDAALRLRFGNYRLSLYANIVGLDPRWEMFSNVKGMDWRYHIEGYAADGESWVLPLAGQSERGFWDKYFFDFKEGKLRLNTAKHPAGRKAYAQFLCKKFQGRYSSLAKVQINVQYQKILEPTEALRRGTHFDSQVLTYPLETAVCAG